MLSTFQAVERQSRLPVAVAATGLAASPAQPSVLEPLASVGVTIRAERDEEIAAQGELAGYCYLIVSGCVRTVRLMEDGRRQVGEFLFSGDLFGWESLEEYDFGAEAVTPATVRRYPRRSLDALADNDRTFAQKLRALTAGQLRAGRERLVLLGRKTASERIASFLLEMAKQMGAEGQGLIELPMSRADMADYLGLTQFRRDGIIAVERSRVVVHDRRALGAAGCEVLH